MLSFYEALRYPEHPSTCGMRSRGLGVFKPEHLRIPWMPIPALIHGSLKKLSSGLWLDSAGISSMFRSLEYGIQSSYGGRLEIQGRCNLS